MTTPTIDSTSIPASAPISLNDLIAGVRGPVFEPGDPDFANECSGFQLGIVPNPAIVVGATCVEDVQAAVRYAATNGLPIAVQATGHGLVTDCSGAVLIKTSRMAGIEIDVVNRRARVESGVIIGDVTAAAFPHGLVPLSGSTPQVGAVGYHLGGGLPILGRKHGFAADHVRRIEIVTPDGELRVVTPSENVELFWALRGGKGNFGVVTSLEFDLFPMPVVYAGALLYPGERMAEIVPAFADWTKTLPEEMSTSIAIFRFPPIEDVPEPFRGKFMIGVRAAHPGDVAEAEALLAPMRALGPVLDTVAPLPWTESAAIHMDPQHPVPVSDRGMSLASLDEAAIASLLRAAGPETDCSLLMVEMRLLGGALARQPEHPSAVSHRDAAFTLYAVTVAMPELAEKNAADFERLVAEMTPHSTGGAFVNFLGAEDVRNNTVKRAFDEERYARLLALKRQYDPQNLFRTHHTIA